MRRGVRYWVASVVSLGCAWGTVAGAAEAPIKKWTFDDCAVGAAPKTWKIEATKQDGPLATWSVVEETTSTGTTKALALTQRNHTSKPTFNLCWTDSVSLKDIRVKVRLKANSGADDQGGGPMWRVQDKDNYYVCRANPLEDNFRLYYVKEGKRVQLANADLKIPSGEWHEIEVKHIGNHIVCSLNGKKLLEANDATLPKAGGVGLWTKADAATSFDDLEVQPAGEVKKP